MVIAQAVAGMQRDKSTTATGDKGSICACCGWSDKMFIKSIVGNGEKPSGPELVTSLEMESSVLLIE